MRRQARRRSPNRLGNRYSADERPMPHAAGQPAASDRLRVAESGRDRRTRDMSALHRFPATAWPPASARSLPGARSPADTRSPAGGRFLAGARSPIGTRFLAGVRFLATAHRRLTVPRASAPPASAAGASVARAAALRRPSRGRPLLSPGPPLCAWPRRWPPTPRVRPRRRVRPWRRLPALEPRPPFVLPRLWPPFGLRDGRWRRRATRGRVRCPNRERGRAGSVLLPAHGLPRVSRGSYDGSIRQAPV